MIESWADLGLQHGLWIIGSILIIGILAHGYWYMYRDRSRLELSPNKKLLGQSNSVFDHINDIKMLRAELPNGGARVLSVPEQGALDLQNLEASEKVPVLMEPADQKVVKKTSNFAESTGSPKQQTPEKVAHPHLKPETPTSASEHLPKKYIVLHIVSTTAPFKGQVLLEALLAHRMAWGELGIFHMLDEARKPSFSLMNAVEPGSFDVNAISSLETPALSVFMCAHKISSPRRAFDAMLATSQSLAEVLGGELQDESRSVITLQTIEQYRLELQQYE